MLHFVHGTLDWQSIEPTVPVILAIGGTLVMIFLALRWRRLKRRTPPDSDLGLTEPLAELPSVPENGSARLMFEGLPVRVRLVVLAPSGRNADITPSMVERTLDNVLYGLGQAMRLEQPRIRIWPAQLSQHGFAPAFFRRVVRPESGEQPSRWILVAGPARVGANIVLLGLALETREPTLRGSVAMKVENWPDRFRFPAPR